MTTHSSSSAPRYVSLFSGAGGLDIGLEQAGWHTATVTDIDRDSVDTLLAAQAAEIAIDGGPRTFLSGTRIIEADVSELHGPDLWAPSEPLPLLVGGPPCQPWSSAGSQRGLGDPRGSLLLEMLRLVGELRPELVLMENVQGLVTARGWTGTHGEVLMSIQNDLTDLGYASRVALLNAADYGAAQRRVRLILFASRTHALPETPVPSHARDGASALPWRTLGQLIADLGAADEADIVRPRGTRADDLRALEPGTGLKTQGRVMANRPSGQWGYRQDSFLADLALPSRTIRAASTPDWVRLPGESDLRRLTWRECAALQGFPAEWPFAGNNTSRFRQIGNAVQTDMARAAGTALMASHLIGPAATSPITPEWPADLRRRVRYTLAEHRVNGHLRQRPQAAN